jgi:sigma-B regulation protein RsbU (phosphoserine phosphatase)
MRILIIDDSEDARDLTEGALLSGGYDDVVTAASGWEAIKMLDIGRDTDERPSVDIVLLDVVMPEMDGVEACARIRNDPRYVDIPIIMLTSLDAIGTLSNAFGAGANDYVTKPVNRVELIARVRAALRLKSELDRRQARERELLGFLSSWGDRRASLWIDEATGLFVGEAAEAYLTSATGYDGNEAMSIVALTIDRLEGYRRAHGDDAVKGVLSEVARAVRRLAATVGIVAASYRNGMIILVAPEFGANSARELGETLHSTVSKLCLPNSESVASDHVTASVATVTGQVKGSIDRVHLLTQAIAKVQHAADAGGNRVLATTV